MKSIAMIVLLSVACVSLLGLHDCADGKRMTLKWWLRVARFFLALAISIFLFVCLASIEF